MPEDAYFPVDVASIAAWCASSKVPEDEGRARFLQVSALRSVLDDERLADYVVFKGAGALRLFYGLPRRSGDLDFVVRRDEAAQAKLHDREQVSR
ncbi:MAG: nucleotidyl transferase AbiEii/AbiGii toxin family protein, partial [Planctomycetota bacterium]